MTANARTWLTALLKPLPLAIGAIGYGVAVAVKTLPLFAPYATSWHWLLILTAVCHALLAFHESHRSQGAAVDDPLVGALLRLRGRIAARGEHIGTQAMRVEIPQLVSQLDQEILPRLQALAVRHRQLGAELAAYRNPRDGRIKPSPPVLRDLQQLYERQEVVMRGMVQEVADIDATLAGFTQEGDEQSLVLAMQAWKKNLAARWESLKELLDQ
jgi:hypothetical protein